MQNIFNFRDLGGTRVQGGRVVKHGVFLRSSSLDDSSPSDIEALQAYKIKIIFDFRDNHWHEMRKQWDKSHICEEYVNVPVAVKSANLIKMKRLSLRGLKRFDGQDMIECYQNLLVNNESYQRLFALIKEAKTPLLFNCAVGKDRTGVAAAVILYLLGAPREEIIREYCKSDIAVDTIRQKAANRIPRFVRKYIMKKLEPMFVADPAFISAVVDKMDELGGVYKYFANEYGYTNEDIERLRELYTEFSG